MAAVRTSRAATTADSEMEVVQINEGSQQVENVDHGVQRIRPYSRMSGCRVKALDETFPKIGGNYI